MNGAMQIGWKNDDSYPSGQGENRARAVKEGDEIKRAQDRASPTNCCTTSILQSRAASRIAMCMEGKTRCKETYTSTVLRRRYPCRQQR